jgi:CDP-2,3-bis-(O-geranylgeranyl)-sn-glycerol synthase
MNTKSDKHKPFGNSPLRTRVSLAFVLLQSFWFFLPAYVANPAAVLFGGGRPIDGGRVLADGHRLLGDGKTWRGFGGGVAVGVLVGFLQWGVAVAVEPELAWGGFPVGVAPILALAFGALLGDMLGAYVKRRMGRPRGANTPGLDWYDFYLGAFVLLVLADYAFFVDHFVRGDAIFGLVLVTVITPVLHRAVNILGFRLGKKDVPW